LLEAGLDYQRPVLEAGVCDVTGARDWGRADARFAGGWGL